MSGETAHLPVLSVASELYPLIKTGGLADVAGALPAAMAGHGVEMVSLVPGYPAVLGALAESRALATLDLLGDPATLIAGHAHGLDLLVLDAPHLYDRPGSPYADGEGRDWPDNARRFAALALAAARIAEGVIPQFRPRLIHAHDWQAALAPAYLHYRGIAVPSLLTVHNLAFQGRFPADQRHGLELPEAAMTIHGVEYYGDLGFLKAGLRFASHITTVSPSYAEEIASEAGGMGLGGLLAGRAAAGELTGILNGIDTAIWDPAQDPLLPRPFSAHQREGRAAARRALLADAGFDPADAGPVFGVVSRLTWQKGLDLLLELLPDLLARGGRLVLLGSGEPGLEQGFRAAAEARPDRVSVRIGYDEARAHLLQAGADVLLVPSRFEPCGLTQMCALRYGAVPLVARTGGLADTVIDANPAALAAEVATGLQFAPVERPAFAAALARAFALFADRPAWDRIQANAMRADVSWTRSAAAYAALYRRLAGTPG
ncbi:glycogen synthase GlgA [Sphingomonas morindae]|uniref:Glycogen synthase n=1 Tax=Sphingomonas morindae TaxID=1541170 RepID=A0ABY4X468_9SPHN|nr:glycogen synthase GlgA [Sphingomonas morindae]USI71674.1 glycogen synthase GlgA [Sphingomonas morindae]